MLPGGSGRRGGHLERRAGGHVGTLAGVCESLDTGSRRAAPALEDSGLVGISVKNVIAVGLLVSLWVEFLFYSPVCVTGGKSKAQKKDAELVPCCRVSRWDSLDLTLKLLCFKMLFLL